MTKRRVLRCTVLAAFGLLIAGCGSSSPAPSASAPSLTTDVRAAESSVSAQANGSSADAVDACALLPKEEVGTLIGATVDGVPNGIEARTGCVWENPTTNESVTVDIGSPGTAPNDTLPALEPGVDDVSGATPGPDGTRIMMGAVEFAAGTRHNSVQVATPVTMTYDQAIAAAMNLMKEIEPKIPG